ncbi:MAG: pyridoxal phosphate-dependent decarboxylase family protein [Ilumatobacteraceae bacterium]
MHSFDRRSKRLSWRILSYALARMRTDPPLDHSETPATLRARAGHTVTERGIGGDEALRIWRDVLAPACISVDHPRFFSYVPGAPTEAAGMFDVAISAANVYAGSWQEGAGAVFAENEALAWIVALAGLPGDAGGVFVSGGTAGNLSALIAARWKWRHDAGGRHDRSRGVIVASRAAHSSVQQAARAMDADVEWVDVDQRGRMNGAVTRAAFDRMDSDLRGRVFAVVATAGTTNVGVVDDLEGIGSVARSEGLWFHVDGAYGAAALCAPSRRHLFAGIEHADSLIVDPHKWLFAPFDSCALVYRDPRVARAAHTQRAEYLDPLHTGDDWNPSDYAHHLSRRPRGLPLWFSLATHGTAAYGEAVEHTLRVTQEGAELVRRAGHLELIMEPELSVLLFRRTGWSAADYDAWSARVLADGLTFAVPTSWKGETCLRLCIVNPETTADDIAMVLESMR